MKDERLRIELAIDTSETRAAMRRLANATRLLREAQIKQALATANALASMMENIARIVNSSNGRESSAVIRFHEAQSRACRSRRFDPQP